MATNILKRIRPRKEDGYLSASELLKLWHRRNPDDVKQIGNYRKNQATTRYIEYLKSIGIQEPIRTTRGRTGGTWMHPKLFMDFIQWVSMDLKSNSIEWAKTLNFKS